LDLLKATGAAATVDIGHVAASPVVKDGIVSAEEFITTVSQYIQSAHVYDLGEVNTFSDSLLSHF
jgi:hypothetical protein